MTIAGCRLPPRRHPAVPERFGDMHPAHTVGGVEIGDGAGDAEDAVPAAGRQMHPVSGVGQQGAARVIRWDIFHTRFATKRINHSVRYADKDVCTNQAESYFSRLRRAEIGTHHHVSGKYLHQYAREMAWREDYRRVPNGEQFLKIVGAAITHPVSSNWKGYWQRSAA